MTWYMAKIYGNTMVYVGTLMVHVQKPGINMGNVKKKNKKKTW